MNEKPIRLNDGQTVVTRYGMGSCSDTVAAWRVKVGLPIPDHQILEFDPADQEPQLLKVLEEVEEFAHEIRQKDGGYSPSKAAKEAADVIFATLSLCAGLAIPVAEVFDAVVLSNFTKTGPVDPETGQIPKGEDYRAPDLANVFESLGLKP